MKKLFIGIAGMLMLALAVPAIAKVNVGGIVFTGLYYMNMSKEAKAYQTKGALNDSWSATRLQVPRMSRIKFKWTNEDNVGMYIELGMGGINSNNNGVRLRHAYGWWDITPRFQLMAGQSTTPFSQLNAPQLLGCEDGYFNTGGKGYGDFYSGRFPQIRGTYKFGKVARVAFVIVDSSINSTRTNANNFLTPAQQNGKCPRLELAVPLHFGAVKVYPAVFWNKKTYTTILPAGSDDDFTAYGASVGANANFGILNLIAEYNYGQNWGNTAGDLGKSSASVNSVATTYTVGGVTRIDDTKCQGGWIAAGFKIGPATPYLIYGFMKTNGDHNKNEYKTQMYGVSIPINLAKGLRLRPELMWYDDGDDNKDTTGGTVKCGKHAVYGVQFQFTF